MQYRGLLRRRIREAQYKAIFEQLPFTEVFPQSNRDPQLTRPMLFHWDRLPWEQKSPSALRWGLCCKAEVK